MDFSRRATPDLNSLFGGGLQHVPGIGYVNAPGGGGALGSEADVMMISGLGAEADAQGRVSSASIDRGSQTLRSILTQPVTVGSVTQPLWLWLLGAIGVAGFAGWWFFLRKK